MRDGKAVRKDVVVLELEPLKNTILATGIGDNVQLVRFDVVPGLIVMQRQRLLAAFIESAGVAELI
jgi:hypothetical protein